MSLKLQDVSVYVQRIVTIPRFSNNSRGFLVKQAMFLENQSCHIHTKRNYVINTPSVAYKRNVQLCALDSLTVARVYWHYGPKVRREIFNFR